MGQNSIEILELGRQTLRRGSTLVINGSHKILPNRESLYLPLNNDKIQDLNCVRSECNLELRNILRSDLVQSTFDDTERESLIRSDNTFILSEHNRCMQN